MRYVIIGNGAAGNAAAAAIRARDPGGEVLIFTDEPIAAYYRPLIVNLLEDGPDQDIFFSRGTGSPDNAGLHLGKSIVALDPHLHQVTLQDGQPLAYDRLLLATGAAAILPEIPGLPGPGAYVLRTMKDAQDIARAARQAKNIVVIGAGRVGLKAAIALKHRGLEVTLVEQGPYPAPMQFDEISGEIVGQALEAAGLRLLMGQTVTSVTRADGRISSATLANGSVLPAEMVIAAAGVRPRMALAQQAGLAVDRGILVDRRLRTSAPDIFAAGDAVETTDLVSSENLVSGLWTNAVEMGRVAGSNMAGAAREYPGALGVLNSLELAGIPTVAIGVTIPRPDGNYEIYQSRRGPNYRKLVFQEGRLVGALLVGDIDGAGVYAGLIRGGAKIAKPGEALNHPRASLASRLFGHLAAAPRTSP